MVPRSAGISVKTPVQPPVASSAAVFVQHASAVSKLGTPFLCLFLFLAYSRIGEFVVPRLHLPMMTSAAAALFALANRGVMRVFRSPVGILMLAFTLWLVVSTPLSYWKGGSTKLLVFTWGKSLVLFITIISVLDSLKQLRLAMNVIAIAVLTAALLCLRLGTTIANRLALPYGFLENPNDLAQLLLLGLPFWLLLSMGRSSVPFRRLVAGFWIIPILIVIAQTGSRSGLVAVAVLGLVIFRGGSLASKVKLTIAGMALLTVALVFLPENIKNRYVILIGAPDDDKGGVQVLDETELQAAASSQQRWMLLLESFRLTMRNPIFGVGPGQFQSFSALEAGQESRLAFWRETHCTYTQISSEAGLPALIFYLTAMLYCIRRTSSIYKSTRRNVQLREISTISYALFLSLVSFAVTAMFSSVGYGMFFPTLAGLCVVFFRGADAQLNALQAAAREEAPASPRQPPSSRARRFRFPARG